MAKRKAVEKKKPDVIYRLKITLLGLTPPIWRRIETLDCTLDDLHRQIQAAMGWDNSHLHHFLIRKRFYGIPEFLSGDFGNDAFGDSTQTQLSSVLVRAVPESTKFNYEYDFGDSWMHEILYEGKTALEELKVRYPRCVEGARACPPDDCGGVWGYANLLKALDDAENEQDSEQLEWLGGPFDPEEFSAEAATKAMRRRLPGR